MPVHAQLSQADLKAIVAEVNRLRSNSWATRLPSARTTILTQVLAGTAIDRLAWAL
jgi:hypothetical protein